MKYSGGARSPASLVISSVWKPYMKDNCELDDLRAGFEMSVGYWSGIRWSANIQDDVRQGDLFWQRLLNNLITKIELKTIQKAFCFLFGIGSKNPIRSPLIHHSSIFQETNFVRSFFCKVHLVRCH